MADASTGPQNDHDAAADRAAAEALFRDDPAPKPPEPSPQAAPGGESFALADHEPAAPTRRPYIPPPSDDEDEPTARPEPRTRARAPRSDDDRPERPSPRTLDDAPAVDHPWTRGAEWGPSITALVGWTIAVWIAIYFLVLWEMYTPALLAFGLGTLGGLALLYPVVITLERPVRMTPEQAVRDYYQALSHHFPHYRRMWLLLSNAGRASTKFASLEGFRRYWKARLAQLREGKAKGSAPLVFQVAGFKSEKSGGKTVIEGTWTLQISVRGRRDEGPIWSIPMRGSFVKGPDNMWYLDDGTLAEPDASAQV